jgi:hypothetical protein
MTETPQPPGHGPDGRADQRPETLAVALQRPGIVPSDDQALWAVIRNSTEALSFKAYKNFIDTILAGPGEPASESWLTHLNARRSLPFPDADTYRLLKVATEVFMMVNCGVILDDRASSIGLPAQYGQDPVPGVLKELASGPERERWGRTVTDEEFRSIWQRFTQPTPDTDPRTLPYYQIIWDRLGRPTPYDPADDRGLATVMQGILRIKLTIPSLLELLWSYWHEEGMLVQTLGALSARFQNRRVGRLRDPLAQLEIDPLRPLNNLLWGYIQDEDHRLTVARRAYEYDHQYGITLLGKAVPQMRTADSRSRFLEGFHNLMNLCATFYKEVDDTTVIADGFPILAALKEVHLLLVEGQHNQYGDLPWTSRQEMLMGQWILARPEIREFLPSRPMVDYPEAWMPAVDSMKRLQEWDDCSVIHFRDLAVFGERILLSARFRNWNDVIDGTDAANWARYFRPEIQGYLHAYRAVTGVDLTVDPVDLDYTMPAVHLRRRVSAQRARRLSAERRPAGLLGRSRPAARVLRVPSERVREPEYRELPAGHED